MNRYIHIYTQTTVFVLTNNERCREIKHTIHSSVSIFYLLFFPYLSTCLSLALHCWVVFEHFLLTKESCFSWAHMILDHEWTIDPNKQCKTLNTTCMCLKKKNLLTKIHDDSRWISSFLDDDVERWWGFSWSLTWSFSADGDIHFFILCPRFYLTNSFFFSVVFLKLGRNWLRLRRHATAEKR